MMQYHAADHVPSLEEAERALPGGRMHKKRGLVEFQCPFEPRPGKYPCAFFLAPNQRDGWTVTDARAKQNPSKHDPIKLKDKVREILRLPFQLRANGKAHRPAGGPVVREVAAKAGAPPGEGGDRASRLPLIYLRDIEKAPRKEWLVYNLFGAGELSCVFGAPGSCKSTLMGDLAGHVAAGMDWFGRRTQKGGVLYVAAERPKLVARRMAAFKKHHGIDDAPFGLVGVQPDLRTSSADAEAIIAHAKRLEDDFGAGVVLIILETVNRLLAGGDENSSKDMGALIRVLGAMQNATTAHVSTVHHTPIDGNHRLRGHGSLLGACDTTGRTEKRGPVGTLTIDKANDAPEGERVGFTLMSVELHSDDESGTKTTAPVVVPAVLPARAEGGPNLTPNQKTMFSILHAAGTTGLTTEQWNEKAREAGLAANRKSDLYDLRQSLKSKALVRQWNETWIADR